MTIHQSTTPSLSQTIWPRWASRQFLSLPEVQAFLPVTFGYSLSSEAVVMRQLRRWKRLWRRSLSPSHKRTSMRPSRSYWNGQVHCSRRRLLGRGLVFHMWTINKSAPTKKVWKLIVCTSYIYIYIYIYIFSYEHYFIIEGISCVCVCMCVCVCARAYIYIYIYIYICVCVTVRKLI